MLVAPKTSPSNSEAGAPGAGFEVFQGRPGRRLGKSAEGVPTKGEGGAEVGVEET